MSNKGRKLLVVEDEAVVLANILELLDSEGYQAVGARDGEEAFRLLQEDRPDLILCDVRMPRLNGLGLLARIAQDSALANIPFVFLSALKERADLRSAMALGADDYITKPYTRKELLDAVRRRLDKHEALRSEARRNAQSFYEGLVKALPIEMTRSLAQIKQLAEELAASNGQIDAEQVRSTGQKIQQAAERLSHSAANYLLLSRLNASTPAELAGHAAETPGLDVQRALEEIALSTAWQHGREEDLHLDLREGRLAVNETSFQIIAEETLASAFEHTTPGSLVELTAALSPLDGMFRMVISHHGRGFTHAELEGLRQTDMKRSDDFLEIGVGMILARKLVEILGGEFDIQSEPGQGTRMVVDFPLSQS